MSLTTTDYLLWVIGPVLLALTCGALVKRRLAREFPVFFAYVAFHLARSVLFAFYLLHLRQRMSYADYFYAYWVAQAVSVTLGFTVIYEVYCRIFQNYDALRQLASVFFGGAAVVLLLVAVLTAAFAPGTDAPGIVRAVVLLERSVRMMQCGLLMFLFVLSFYFGLPWRSHIFGIALGFGVFATIELAAVAVRLQVGVNAAIALSWMNSAAYACGVLIWVCYLLAREPAPQYRGVVARHDLEEWNQALLEMLER